MNQGRTNSETRKRRTSRLAILMMVLALITTTLVVGTLSKYTVGGDGNDAATVAKWGVRVSVADDSSFKTEYKTSATDSTISVKSSGTHKLVAPGTADDGSITFSIVGTPEVRTRVKIDFNCVEDVFYKYGTGAADVYYPIEYTLYQVSGYDGVPYAQPVELVKGNLEAIQEFIDGWNTADGTVYAPNTDLDSQFKLTWSWEFEDDTNVATQDGYDTVLGDLAAGLNDDGLTEGTDYNLDVDYNITITVEQVD